MDDLGFDEPDNSNEPKRIKIAQITFAYYNGEVIRWLTKRGDFIKTEKWDKVNEINQEIAQGIKDEDLLNRCQKPCSVFATFETEEGYNRAIIYNEQQAVQGFLSGEIEIQEASEPSDIIWENRQFKPWQRTQKRIVVYFIIVIMLAISAAIIFTCTKASNAKKFKYPVVTCSDFKTEYASFSEGTWLKDSMNEFYSNNALEK